MLAAPNPLQIWEELVDEIVGRLYLAGDEFLEGVTVRGGTKLIEIYALRRRKQLVCTVRTRRASLAKGERLQFARRA